MALHYMNLATVPAAAPRDGSRPRARTLDWTKARRAARPISGKVYLPILSMNMEIAYTTRNLNEVRRRRSHKARRRRPC